MAVTVTNNLTLVDGAESSTGWTSDGGGLTAVSGFQREGTNCLGDQASSGAVHAYFTITSADLSAHTIFVWLRSGNPTSEATGGFRIVLGDGTNRAAYYVGGSDNYGFFFNGWSCFRLDTANRPANFTVLAGAEASINTSAITDIGGGWNYASKAVGNTDNVFIDVVRYIANGTPALNIGGGGSGTEGLLSEIVALDENTTNAWGVIRSLIAGTKSYEIQYGINFGDTGTGSSFFSDADAQVFINGSTMSAGNMDVNVIGNTTGTNLFELRNTTIVNVGAVSNWDVDDVNIDTMNLTGSQFVDMGTFLMPANTATKSVIDCTFINCGQVTANTVTFTGALFRGSTDATGALLIADTTNISDLTFNSDGTGHAILITDNTNSPFSFTSFNYADYASVDGTTGNEVLFNNSGGAITVNVSGGDTPTVRDGAGASTTVNNTVNITLDGMRDNTEVRVYTAGTRTELAGVEDATTGTVDDRSFTFSLEAGLSIDINVFNLDFETIYIRSFTVPNNDASIPISQKVDRSYDNPV